VRDGERDEEDAVFEPRPDAPRVDLRLQRHDALEPPEAGTLPPNRRKRKRVSLLAAKDELVVANDDLDVPLVKTGELGDEQELIGTTPELDDGAEGAELP
jgi:hypothetical protein